MSRPTPGPIPAPPARRADAERNRDKILAAARAALAGSDAQDVSMAEISRRAGVGMATLYRNFPGRRELLEALYTDEVNAVCDAAETTAATVDEQTPGAALTAWLRRFFAFSTSKRHVASELLKHTDRSDPVFGRNRARVLAAGRPLLDASALTRCATTSRSSRSSTWSSPSPRSTATPGTSSPSSKPRSTACAPRTARRPRRTAGPRWRLLATLKARV
jgi:AcrR family transcriptional regulator